MNSLHQAIRYVGSQAELARRLGVRPQLISQWKSGKRPIPPARAAQIEEITQGEVKRQDLLPDFPWVVSPTANHKTS